MRAQTIQPAALAELAKAGGNFSVSVHARDDGWTVYAHVELNDYSLVDVESDRVGSLTRSTPSSNACGHWASTCPLCKSSSMTPM